MIKILVSLTTYKNPDWQKNIADLKRFGVNEFAFFPTTIITENERMEIMRIVKKELPHAVIPFCHIRHDSAPREIDFLIENFQTKKINVHPDPIFIPDYDYSKYTEMTYIENAGARLTYGIPEKIIKEYAGICLDLSHLENCRRQLFPAYAHDLALAEQYPIGMNHISAMTDEPLYIKEISSNAYERHYLENLGQVDYIKQYYPKYFGEYAAIELQNSIDEQIEIKKYIETLLKLN